MHTNICTRGKTVENNSQQEKQYNRDLLGNMEEKK
jgi:hypothetical protein